MNACMPNPAQPPFACHGNEDAAAVGARMIEVFGVLERRPDRLSWGFDACVAALGLDPALPACVGGRAIALDIDRGVGNGMPGGYHTPQHFLEVMLSALQLTLRAELAPSAALTVLVAALVHDFHYDGRRDPREPFRMESIAARRAMPYLETAGVDAAQRARIERLVLATEPTVGVPFVRRCHAIHLGATDGPPPPVPLQALAVLRDDPALARDCALLVEADVLPSIGLSVDYGWRLQARLAHEWHRPLGAHDKIQFVEHVFGPFVVGAFFEPNRLRLRDACLARLQAEGVASDAASARNAPAGR